MDNANTYATGTVVRCERVQQGQPLGITSAIILGRFGDQDSAPYRVWFYTQGAAAQGDAATVSLAFPREIKSTHGTIEDFSLTTLRTIVRGSKDFAGAVEVWRNASTALVRKRAALRAAR